MASIVGEKYRNATASDLADLDTKIAQVKAEYDNFNQLFHICAAKKENNFFYNCNNRLGYSYFELNDLRNRRLKTLTDLKKQRAELTLDIEETMRVQTEEAEITRQAGEAAEAVGKGIGMASVYGLIAVLAIIAGVYFYKKSK